MRVRVCSLQLAVGSSLWLAAAAPAQTWDKFLAPGFTYRMEVDLGTPRIIHAIRHSPQSASVFAAPELGGLRVYEEDPSKGRQTISELVKQAGAIGGVNGDFFPFTGDPLGLMVKNGELISSPWPKRAVFAWGKKGSIGGVATLDLAGQNGSLGRIVIDGLNQECGPGNVVLNTSAAGHAMSKGAALHIVLKRTDGDWKAGSSWTGAVEQVVRAECLPVPEGGAVLTASNGDSLAALKPGDSVTFELKANGLEWARFDQAIGGGPFLVREGKVAADWDYQGFNANFALKRHPRTAVGRTKSGDIWFVAVDGRQKLSDGATLEEMARIMLRYGCVEAVNLDGGGSTTFHLLGMTLNRPSDGQERPVANGVLFFGGVRGQFPKPIKIAGPARLALGSGDTLKAFRSDGTRIENANVIWQSAGSGWVDQGGRVRPTELGLIRVRAWAEGQTADFEIQAVEPTPPSKPAPKKKRRKR